MVILSLRSGDFKEIMAGVAAILRTLGWVEGTRAMAFATRKQLAAMWGGAGLYPEKGKQCVWFKLYFLRLIYGYLKMQSEEQAREHFDSIAKAPTLRFIGNVMPPSSHLTKEYTLHHLWEDYHPNITFSRTQTLVDGDPICNHTVTWTDL